jgi:molecular chaperone HtpG
MSKPALESVWCANILLFWIELNMSIIEIPPRLENLLKSDARLHGGVISSIAEFEPWLRMSNMPFFPEYTDHGPQHLTEVIATASSILSDSSWNVMTSSDAGMLILAILLHDSAMHLTDDGFVALFKPPTSFILLEGDQPWDLLWTEFLSEASRFDARKLIGIFGNAEPVHPPDPSPAKWNLRDRLLIGEFLRRHHPRLAHQIAVHGVPGGSTKNLELHDIPADLANLAGLVARSHGAPLRTCINYLDPKDPREYKGVHAVFLMATLRIADYLQIHSERAPDQLMHVRRLKSPISQREWTAHHAIRDIRNTHEDPEAIFVDAAPSDVATFLKLDRLLRGLQSELDNSWAVLGEVYGRYGALSKLGLTIRRVRSNMDDETAFAKTVGFVPRRAAFETAGADLLKLLVEPLYGNNPAIGIRELIQNAVDACLELRDYLKENPKIAPPDLANQDSQVLVRLEETQEKERFLIVSDQGIGMTTEVILNYFLTAGASFRQSNAWRKQHEDKPGKSRVLRSGRFGIGALATFLIGDEITMSTRHISAPPEKGIAFSATINTEEIELTYVERPVGTTIKVRITDGRTWEALNPRWNDFSSWDWFCLKDPIVGRELVTQEHLRALHRQDLPQQFSLPAANSATPPEWRTIIDPDFKDIQWTYSAFPGWGRTAQRLICNGILIGNVQMEDLAHPWDLGQPGSRRSIMSPHLSVFDPDGRLPLTLQRTALATKKYPFNDALLEDIYRDFIAWALVMAPDGPLDKSLVEAYQQQYAGVKESVLSDNSISWLYFAESEQGTVLVERQHLAQTRATEVLLIPSVEDAPSYLDAQSSPRTLRVLYRWNAPGVQAQKAWLRFASGFYARDRQFGPASELNRVGSRVLLHRKWYEELLDDANIAKALWDDHSVDWRTDDKVLLTCLDFLNQP